MKHFIKQHAAYKLAGKQQGVSLIITLIILVVLTLTAVSVSRVTRTALNMSGNIAQSQMLSMSNDQGLYLAKQALQAVGGVITPAVTHQPWYNNSAVTPPCSNAVDFNATCNPNANFWQNNRHTTTGNTTTSYASTTQTINGQQVTIKYMVRVTPYTFAFPTALGGTQITGTFFQIFTNTSTPDGSSAATEAWYLN